MRVADLWDHEYTYLEEVWIGKVVAHENVFQIYIGFEKVTRYRLWLPE